jgi:tetratricopeptide (TPR) repeat protein
MELAPEGARDDVPQRLLGLVRKELMRPSPATFPDDEAFRFRHLLIRDAAYDALPKATRAELHERFARWLEAHANLVEQDEIVGYHLEQAARYCRELGTDRAALASAAASCLARATREAYSRGDLFGALNLLSRAVELLPAGDPQRLGLQPLLVQLLLAVGELSGAENQIAELAAADEPGPRAYALLFRAEIEITQGVLDDVESVRSRIDRATETFTEIGDERGLALAQRTLGVTLWLECRAEAASAAYARARACAERAGEIALANEMNAQMHACAVFGPTPVAEAIEITERRLAGATGKPLVQAGAKRSLARLLALVGDFGRARTLLNERSETMRDAGLMVAAASGYQARGFVEHMAGDWEASAHFLRKGAEELLRLGDHLFFSSTALALVEALLELHRIDEADKWLEEAAAEANPADIVDSAAIESARGHIAALRGNHAAGIEHAERAVEIAERTDFFDLRTDTHLAHARVLARAGRRDEAAAAYERALAVTRAKGATVWTKQIEKLLAEL